jgi:AcrR family transcriptional regulator
MESNAQTFPPPRQKRSRQSLERFLDAAESVIRAEGIGELNVSEVARLAGFSVGGLYSRFPTRTALLNAVRARFLDRVETALSAEFAAHKGDDATLEGALNTAIRRIFGHFLAEEAMFRAFLIEAPNNPQFLKGAEEANECRKAMFREAVMVHAGEIRHPEPESALNWIFTLVMAVVRERLVYGEAEAITGGYSGEQLISRLCQSSLLILSGSERL